MSSASSVASGGVISLLEHAAGCLAKRSVPGSAAAALDEADRLLRAVDLINLAIDERVGVVDRVGEAKVAGYSSTTAWLRNGSPAPGSPCRGGRLSAGDAVRRKRNGRQFARLPGMVAALREGRISHAMASAIAAAVSVLGDDADAAAAEQILLRLAGDPSATVEKVTRAGKYLRQVLDPDGHLGEHEKAYRNRRLSAHVEDDGSMSGSFVLPPEAAARLQALFDTYARKTDTTDERAQSQRNADVLIQLLAQAVSAELLVIVNAETLPDSDSEAGDSKDGDSEAGDSEDRGGCGGRAGRDSKGGSWPVWPVDPDTVEQARLAAGAAGAHRSGGYCPACGRGTGRDTPGLLLSTGHPLPAPDIRRLAGTSRLHRMVLQAPSRVLDLGTAVRLVPGWMRRAVLATYDTCAYNHCPVPAKWCEMDHIRPWAIHQNTRLADIAPACDHHNRDRAKHPDHYQIGQTRNGRWHITTTHRRRT